MKALLRSRFTWLSVLATVALCAAVALAALIDEDTKVEDLYNYDLHKALATQQATSLRDLADTFILDQYLYLWITPPAEDFILFQPGGTIPILDTTGFPDSFIAGLAGVEDSGIRKFPVWVYEDADSPGREIVIETVLEQKQIARISREWGYSPEWFVRDRYPDLDSYDKEYRDWLITGYDPARVRMRYDLLIGEDDLIKLVWKQSIDAALRAQEEEEGGGMMMMGWEGGSVTNIKFVAIEKTNDAICVTIAYPDDFTNALDIFTCDGGRGLLDFWWEHAVTTNIDSSTNWIAWTDLESTNSYVDIRFYAAANADVDSDGDGYSDGFEKFVYHTCPTNEDSYPLSVSGSISYTGSLTGPVRMIAVTESNSWIGCMASMSGLGAYTNSKVANAENYWFKAYRDCNSNKVREYGEPWGVYTNVSILLTNSLTGIDITLTEDTDEDDDGLPDWWELQYFASIWTQDGDDDSDGDSLTNSDEYTYGTNPANADTDNDRLNDYAEIFTYSTCATNADTDCDNMGDGTEVDNGMSPSTSNAYYSLPFTEGFETNTVQTGSISNQNGWIAWPTNEAVVVTDNVYSGQQALAFQESFDVVAAHHLFGAHGQTNVWIDCYAKFDPSNTVSSCETPNPSEAPDWQPCLFAINDRAEIVAYSGAGSTGTWYTCTNATVSSGYHRYTVKQDYTAKTWDMYFDGTNIFTDLGFRDADIVEFSRFSFTGKWMDDAYLDEVSISTTQPDGL